MSSTGRLQHLSTLEVRRTFRDARTAHVGTLLADGTPHVVPLWFAWIEEGMVLSTRVGSQVWKNVLRDDRVAVQIDRGRAWSEQAGVLLRGRAAPLPPDHATAKKGLSAWFDKYREELAGPGFAAYTEQVLEPVLLLVQIDHLGVWMHGDALPGR